jgi:glutamate-ammonia-ligase adenylyltransferase
MGAWERLALLKAYPVAGSRALGNRFVAMARPFIQDQPFDLLALASVVDMKMKLDRKIADRGQAGRNVKLGTGGIREIELVVQTLQVCHGADLPEILKRDTLAALGALRSHALVSAAEFSTLETAYLFLRDVENKLQMINDAQTHSLPRELEELNACARLLGYMGTTTESSSDQLLRDFQHHTGQVNRVFENVVVAADLRRLRGPR